MQESVDEDFLLQETRDILVRFKSYYKYTFTFHGNNEKFFVSSWFGGNHYDIYRFMISADKPIPQREWKFFSFKIFEKDSRRELITVERC